MTHGWVQDLPIRQKRWLSTLVDAFPAVAFDENVIIAGGFMRRLLTDAEMIGTDVDIFLSPKAPIQLQRDLSEGLANPQMSENGRTIKGAIKAFPGCVACTIVLDSQYTEAEALLRTFSLTVCQFAIQGSYVTYSPQGVKDAAKKLMRKVPTATWNMKNLVDKYTHNYGFKPVGELKKRIENGEPINSNEQIDS